MRHSRTLTGLWHHRVKTCLGTVVNVIPTQLPQDLALPDVPSPIDLRDPVDAREWADTAQHKRPWRIDFFEAFARRLGEASPPVRSILELGSGPGFLASHLLRALPSVAYTALDFSGAMHELAQARLGDAAARVDFIVRDFKAGAWADGLAAQDAVVTHQAIHELRHKRHAPTLHAQVRALLKPQGLYLVADHFAGEGGMANDRLYMTVAEQKEALQAAGITRVEQVLLKGGLVLHQARP